MAKTFLKDSTDSKYLENVSNEILEAPDETGLPAARYIVEEDGLPVTDPNDSDKPFVITVT
jgi:hypothetical protein